MPVDSPKALKAKDVTGMVFPCLIDVKIFICNQVKIEQVINRLVKSHLSETDLIEWHSRASSGGKYIAITATVNAQSRQHIDALYQALFDHEHVIMTL